MKYIGAHVSIEGGISKAPCRANEIGAKAFALFTGNSQRWMPAAIKEAEADRFKEECGKYGYDAKHILPHDKFLINLGSPDASKPSTVSSKKSKTKNKPGPLMK